MRCQRERQQERPLRCRPVRRQERPLRCRPVRRQEQPSWCQPVRRQEQPSWCQPVRRQERPLPYRQELLLVRFLRSLALLQEPPLWSPASLRERVLRQERPLLCQPVRQQEQQVRRLGLQVVQQLEPTE